MTTYYRSYQNPPNGGTPEGKGKTKGKTKPKTKPAYNMVPAYYFAAVMFLVSLGLNTYNVYQAFLPETLARFSASGVLNALITMPLFAPLAFGFRLLAGYAGFRLIAFMLKNKKLLRNPVWLVMTFISGYFLFCGLTNVINSIPFLVALTIVAGLQYMEIIFWNARRKSVFLWCLVGSAYTIEAWLQYDMKPFHASYATVLELIQGFTSMGFDWAGFQPAQIILFAIALFGIEGGDKVLNIISKHV